MSRMDKENLKLKVAKYCKEYREKQLMLSLTEFSNLNNVSFKNVWAFENGKANNIIYLYYYYHLSKGFQKELFIKGVFSVWQ